MPAAIRSPFVIAFTSGTVTVGATVNVDLTLARPLDLYEATALALLTQAASTAQISRQALGAGAFSTVTNAMAMDTANSLIRTTTIVVAQRSCVATDVLRGVFVAGGGGSASGVAYVSFIGTPITGQ
mgnify:CR=1 FL=1